MLTRSAHGSDRQSRNGEETKRPAERATESDISLEELRELCLYVSEMLESRAQNGIFLEQSTQLEKTLLPICRLLATIYVR